MPHPVLRRSGGALALALTAILIGACGDDDDEAKSTKSTLSITTTDVGKRFKITVPKEIEGGLVNVRLRNDSKVPHEAQLIRVDDGHTAKDTLDVVTPEKVVLPDWFHAEGGVAGTPPGKSGTATVKLSPGDYVVLDTESDDGPSPAERGALASFKVTGDNGGKIEDTTTKIETKEKGKDEFEFVTSNLKVGTNDLTFDNTSDEIHHVITFPIRGNATIADVKKFLSTQGKPSGPPPVDFEKGSNTSVLDGKRKEIVPFKLNKGRTALVCFLMDRDGKGKEHYKEGMLKEVNLP